MAKKGKDIKCVVWDLDNTLWEGTLLESDQVRLKRGVGEIIKTLDSRGILHSIASKNNFDDAMRTLKAFELDQYFLYPEIHWNAKSLSLGKIQKNLNIGMDTILFIDDQEFEREEVRSVHKEVTCMDAAEYPNLVSHPRLNPKFITEDSRRRRLMYLEDLQRKQEEETFKGPQEQFLASLRMQFVISEAREEDLKRAEELTVRTNQLNATGQPYSYNELNGFITSDDHKLFICELTDKFGSYGKIGLALVEMTETHWHLKLLLISCRVMSRGVGTVLLSYIMQQAKAVGNKLLADFKRTERNKMMYVTYKFANFKELSSNEDGMLVLENDLSRIQPFPPYIEVKIG
jgi:FkbH-like protein